MEQTRLITSSHSFSGRRLSEYPLLVAALFQVKEACARANHAAGDLDSCKASLIAKICQRSYEQVSELELAIDPMSGGGGIAINQNINEFIVSKAASDLCTDDVNRSQSTADVVHTALRMSLIGASRIFCESLQRLAVQSQSKAKEFVGIEIMSRTCLRDALPTSLDKLFSAYAAALARSCEQLQLTLKELGHVNLGGTVIGSGDGASAAYREKVMDELNKISGLELKHRKSLYDAAQNSDDLGRLCSVLETAAGTLIKIARDIRLLSSGPYSGFANLELPEVIRGSSFFRKKINPSIPETLMQAVWCTQGLSHSCRLALAHAELDLNVFDPFAGLCLLEACSSLNLAVNSFSKHCLKELGVNKKVCAEQVRRYKETSDAK